MSKEFKETELNSFLKQKKLNDEVLKTLSLVLDSMAEGVNVSNDKGIILFTNPAFDDVFGYNQDELIGKHVSALTTYSSEETAQIYKEINQTLDTQKVWTGDFSNKNKYGKVFYTEARISALELRGKRCLISVQSDITQRKMMETSLQESETKYRIVSENTYDWGYWISPEKKFVYLSPSCKRITGYNADEFLADPNLINRIIHPEDQPLFAGHRAEAEKQLQSDEIEFRIIRKDGTVRWIGHICQPVFDSDGNFLGTRASNRDLTKRKLAEEMLQKSEEKYRTVADFTYDWEDWLDPSGKYLYISPSCEWITGYRRDEFLDTELLIKITHPDDSEIVKRHFHEEMSDSVEIHHMEFRIITRSGDERWLNHYCQPVYSKNGTFLGRRGSNRDITGRKRAEEELKRSNEDLKLFAYAASHDLQEPLRGIESFIRLLEKRYKGKLDEKADEYIDHVVDDVNRMQMLIKDLLEYSRVSVKDKVVSPVNYSVVLEEALSNLRSAIEESGVEVTYDLLPTVMGDASQLIRLFQNLIGNAIKFRSLEPLKIHISAKREGKEWLFSVRDTGIGIDPKQAERIFVIFQRLHSRQEYPGTGIGLTICKRIVERHGGRIWVESEPGTGARFYFTVADRQGNLLNEQGEKSSDKGSHS